jgi:NitT/TauT family transport system ATP-binding protein
MTATATRRTTPPEVATPSLIGAAAPGEITLRSLRIAFDDVVAVDRFDLAVEAATITVLLGPSGCGKSTVLRAVAGLQSFGGGSITMDGEPVVGTSADRAMVFQEDALLPWRSALANVELALALRGVPRNQRKPVALDLLGQVGLDGFERSLPRQLSGGMRQRVQLARTFAVQPRVLLMDEPFGALDAQTRGAMQRLLVEVWAEHRTTVMFVTHDVDEALLLADRIVVVSPRPGSVRKVVDIENPRAPGGRFEANTNRLRYELLACLDAETRPGSAAETPDAEVAP